MRETPARAKYRGIRRKGPYKQTDNMSGDGKLEKMEVDYSTTVDEKIPECEQLVKVGF